MKFDLNVLAGKYVVAVSGGIDSVVLLHALSSLPDLELVVVYVNHGIRAEADNQKDENLVRSLSAELGLELIVRELGLGPDASEDMARMHRHEALRQVLKSKNYNKIITAHHKDDVVETMIINLLRGTGRKGLSSLKNNETYLRPLINASKSEIRRYAKEHNLTWREDSTNTNQKYLRNYIRLTLLPKMEHKQPTICDEMFEVYKQMLKLNEEIDIGLEQLSESLKSTVDSYDRQKFIMLPIEVSYNLLHCLLADRNIEVNAQMLKQTRNFIHTAKPGKLINISRELNLMCSAREFSFVPSPTSRN